jgi:heme exporter protein CcmD
MSSFWAMGGYAVYIWPAYAVSALGLVGATLWTLSAYAAVKKRLKQLEADK